MPELWKWAFGMFCQCAVILLTEAWQAMLYWAACGSVYTSILTSGKDGTTCVCLQIRSDQLSL